MNNTEEPDYGTCVDLVTKGALRRMVAPGLLAVGIPVAVGFTFRLFITPEDPTLAAEAVPACSWSEPSSASSSPHS